MGKSTYSGIPTAGTSLMDDRTANGSKAKATNTWSIHAQGRAIRSLTQRMRLLGEGRTNRVYRITTGCGARVTYRATKGEILVVQSYSRGCQIGGGKRGHLVKVFA